MIPASDARSNAARTSSRDVSAARPTSAASNSRPQTAATSKSPVTVAGSRRSRRATTSRTLSGRFSASRSSCPASRASTRCHRSLSMRWRASSSRKNGLPAVAVCNAAIDAGRNLARRKVAQQLTALFLRQASHRDACREGLATQVREIVGERMIGRKLNVSVAGDDEQPSVDGRPFEVTEKSQGGLVGPLQIVEDEHGRLRRRDGAEQRGERLEQPISRGFGIARARREELRNPAQQLGKEAGEVLLHSVEDLAQRPWRTRGDTRAERLDERLVRAGGLFVAPSVQHRRAETARVVRELAGDARLADPGLTADHNDLKSAVTRLPQGVDETSELTASSRQLCLTTRECRLTHLDDARKCAERLQWREQRRQSRDRQLVHTLRARDPGESVLAEIQQHQTIGQRVADELRGETRQHDLPAVRRGHQPACSVQHRTEVVAISLPCLARVNADADAQRPGRPPMFGREYTRGSRRRDHRGARAVEYRVSAVARRFDHGAAVRFDRGSENRVVTSEGVTHGVRMFFPEARRVFEVGEHERHDPRGHLGHACTPCSARRASIAPRRTSGTRYGVSRNSSTRMPRALSACRRDCSLGCVAAHCLKPAIPPDPARRMSA